MKVHPDNDALLDRCEAAYRNEYDRWCVRRNKSLAKSGKYDRYELVRNTSPNGDIVSEDCQEVTLLTHREAASYTDAEGWLNTYRGRAAMRAALEAA